MISSNIDSDNSSNNNNNSTTMISLLNPPTTNINNNSTTPIFGTTSPSLNTSYSFISSNTNNYNNNNNQFKLSYTTPSSSIYNQKKNNKKRRNPFIGPSPGRNNFPEFPDWACPIAKEPIKNLFDFSDDVASPAPASNIKLKSPDCFILQKIVEETSLDFDNYDDDDDSDQDDVLGPDESLDYTPSKKFEFSIDTLSTAMPVNITFDHCAADIDQDDFDNSFELFEFKKWKIEDEKQSNDYFGRQTNFPHTKIPIPNQSNPIFQLITSNNKDIDSSSSTTSSTTSFKRKSLDHDQEYDDDFNQSRGVGVSTIDEYVIENINLSSICSSNASIIQNQQTRKSVSSNSINMTPISTTNSFKQPHQSIGTVESSPFSTPITKCYVARRNHIKDDIESFSLASPITKPQTPRQNQIDDDLFLTPIAPSKLVFKEPITPASSSNASKNPNTKVIPELPDISPIKIKQPGEATTTTSPSKNIVKFRLY
ncbi:hypothetical protein CYY_008631 [Polysphondylium violaceum]|uniref:Uncharacterized protein n=1 Tax=Polysphondylium violaceum TaxID=133409 RepID=A0A8J4V3Q9_9MYCE|nr:hypothetical protein CYY_008631 [Polysphondylium violaceum]